MRNLSRWITIGLLVLFLVTYPRGYLPQPLHAEVRSTMPVFSWSHWEYNLVDFFTRVFTLSFGQTVDLRAMLPTVVSEFLPSLTLVGCGTLFVLVLGTLKGCYDGLRQTGTVGRGISSAVQWFAESVPDFFIIIALEFLFFFLGRRHIANLYIVGNHHFVMGTLVPALILSLIPIMYLARIVRRKVEEQYGQLYLITASAKGLSQRHVFFRHLMPNVLPTIFEGAIPAMGILLSNLLLVEYLTYRNGIVSGILDAVGTTNYAPVGAGETPPVQWQYMPFDTNRMILYVLGIFVVFLLYSGLMRLIIRLFGWRGQRNTYGERFQETEHHSLRQVWAGCVLFALVLLTGVMSPVLPIPSPTKTDVIHFEGSSMTTPPFPPSFIHWLGTDDAGHDLFSQTAHATLPTFAYLGICVVVILVFALVLSLISSLWRTSFARYVIGVWNGLTTVMPSVVLAILILTIPAIAFSFVHLQPFFVTWGFGHRVIYLSVICFVETGRAAFRLQSALDDLEKRSYMEAAVISGHSPWSRFRMHHWKTFRLIVLEQCVVLFSRVLLVIAALGFLYMPMSASWQLTAMGWGFTISPTDWGGILATNVHNFLSEGNGWLVFAPTLFITVSIISMNLIQAGIHAYNLRLPNQSRRQEKFVDKGVSI